MTRKHEEIVLLQIAFIKIFYACMAFRGERRERLAMLQRKAASLAVSNDPSRKRDYLRFVCTVSGVMRQNIRILTGWLPSTDHWRQSPKVAWRAMDSAREAGGRYHGLWERSNSIQNVCFVSWSRAISGTMFLDGKQRIQPFLLYNSHFFFIHKNIEVDLSIALMIRFIIRVGLL